MLDWRLVQFGATQANLWSFGLVRTVEDLYCRKIFGPMQDLACACGKYCNDARYAGIICDVCGVNVCQDSLRARSTRLGHLDLAVSCRFPPIAGSEPRYAVPVAPVAFRVQGDGTPSVLGRRYEQLVAVNHEITAAGVSIEDHDAWDSARARLEPLLADLTGLGREGGGGGAVDRQTLLEMLMAAIATGIPDACPLTRAMGLSIEVHGRM